MSGARGRYKKFLKRQGNIPAMLVHSRMGLIAACSSFGMTCLGMVHTQCSRSCGARLQMCNHFDAALWGEGWWHIGLQTTTPDRPTIHHFPVNQPHRAARCGWLPASGVSLAVLVLCALGRSPHQIFQEKRSAGPTTPRWLWCTMEMDHYKHETLTLCPPPSYAWRLKSPPPSNGTSHLL